MAMEFVRIRKTSTFLDPFQNYAPSERFSEVRRDPLTGLTTRILDFPVKQMEKADLSGLAEQTKQFCPFCPGTVEQITPKFNPVLLPQARYARGESLCFPNAFPYDENGAVTVMTKGHYVDIAGFSKEIVCDALSCCVDYLEDVLVKQPETIYQSINWNYMPLAGSSIVHPHLQVMASSTPTNYYNNIQSSLARYRESGGADFWQDLIKEEQSLGERFIRNGSALSWLVAFAPMGVFDVIGVLGGVRRPSDIQGKICDELSEGIVAILRFIGSLNLYSFNMALYFVIGDGLFTPHVRICPRVSLPPLGTNEVNYMKMLHNETLTPMKPEEICGAIKSFWK